MTPSGTVAVNYGDNKQFTISANTGYHFSDLLVDGVHVDSTTSYTFMNVTENHTIAASFAANVPTLVSVTPDSAARGDSVNVVFVGTDFIAGVTTINTDAGIDVMSFSVHSTDTIYATLDISGSAVLGAHTLSVTNAVPGGGTSNTLTFKVLASLSVKDGKNRMPTEYALYQNYPNPFNPSTTIAFDLPQASNVTIGVFNLLGQKVITLLNGVEMSIGTQQITLNGNELTSGIYFYRIEAIGMNGKTFTSVKRMILMK